MTHTEKKPKKIFWMIVLIAAAMLVAACAVLLILRFLPDNTDLSSFKNDTSQSDALNSVSSAESSDAAAADNPIDFAALQASNSDVCGWIQIPGTIIDYPVVQSAADEPEDFYLDHDINKKYKADGCIYIQKMNYRDFSDPNTVIYGHDLINGKMFSQLRRFKRSGFFNENRTMYIYIPGHILTYDIFSAFVYDDRHILNSYNFYKADEYAAFLKEALDPASMVRNVREGANVTTEDRIITLSTCTDRAGERYLVEGVLINDEITR